MNENIQYKQPTSIEQLIGNLHTRRKEILSMSAEAALDAVIDHPQPAALVHSFPEEDFYFLIHDIGAEDALELLSLASDKQWEYILDVEVWEQDRITLPLVTKWLHLLIQAAPNRLIKWFLDEKTEFVEYYLAQNIEVRIREHDQDPSEFGDDFFTIDDVFYVRFKDMPYDDKALEKEQRDEFLAEFLNRLATYDHFTYQNVMFEFSTVVPSEFEEEAYRMRNVRLAEKGFMPFDEAIGIYQPLKPELLKTQTKRLIPENGDRDLLPRVPMYPVEMMKEDHLFTHSLKVIEMNELLQQLQAEFAGLCNQVIAADQKPIRERAQLKTVVKKVCGYISIGLERMTKEDDASHVINHSAALIQKFSLSRIFRVGYGLALELKWQAEKWQKQSWFAKAGLPLTFWGEEWMGVLGGLLIKKPLFFDNYETGVLFREFVCLGDIEKTERIFNEIKVLDDIISLMAISFESVSKNAFFTYKGLMLTLWARHRLGLSENFSPLRLDEFRQFFEELWSGKDKPRKIRMAMKESFLGWLLDRTGTDAYEITEKAAQTLENLFKEIESEYGSVSAKDLDPRFIHLFLVV